MAETTGLRETIHALANFEVNGVVVEEGFKVVCGDSGVGDFVAFNAYVFIAGGRKWSAKVKIFDVNREPSDIVDWSRSLTTSKLAVRADTS